jgi:Fe2+ transport system protein B
MNDATVSEQLIKYPAHIEQLISRISDVLPQMLLSKRFVSLMILENNGSLIQELKFHYAKNWKHIAKIIKGSKDYYGEINETRKTFITEVIRKCIASKERYYKHANIQPHRLDRVLLNK